MPSEPVRQPYPDAAPFLAHAAYLWGMRHVVDVGLSWTREMTLAWPELDVTGIVLPGQRPPADYPGSLRKLEALRSKRGRQCALLVAANAARVERMDVLVEEVSQAASRVNLAVVATDRPEPLVDRMTSLARRPEFVGRTRLNASDEERRGHVLVYDGNLTAIRSSAPPPPEEFRVVAIIPAYNEEDVIGPAIEKLLADGVGVYVVDNWSTDRTEEIVRGFEGRGLVGYEKFPAAAPDRSQWTAILRRTEQLARELDATWVIHHDADERRSGPWPGLGLRDSLWVVDRAGFSAIDHTVINFRPVDDSHVPGEDFEARLRHFEMGKSGDLMLQVKAWKNLSRVNLVATGGHRAIFPGARVFPYKFLLKHYPIRSQSHGERKVMRDRLERWDPAERARGWHAHYDDLGERPSFLRDPADLLEFREPETRARFLPEILTGAGLASPGVPDFARRSDLGRRMWKLRRAVGRNRLYQEIRQRRLPSR